MKKYMKPLMERQVFSSNEYVAACYASDYKFVCENMGEHSNRFTSIIHDENRNGKVDQNESTYKYGGHNIDFQDDCGMSGNGNHTISNPSELDMVLIKFADEEDYVATYAVPYGNSVHFVLIKSFNHS